MTREFWSTTSRDVPAAWGTPVRLHPSFPFFSFVTSCDCTRSCANAVAPVSTSGGVTNRVRTGRVTASLLASERRLRGRQPRRRHMHWAATDRSDAGTPSPGLGEDRTGSRRPRREAWQSGPTSLRWPGSRLPIVGLSGRVAHRRTHRSSRPGRTALGSESTSATGLAHAHEGWLRREEPAHVRTSHTSPAQGSTRLDRPAPLMGRHQDGSAVVQDHAVSRPSNESQQRPSLTIHARRSSSSEPQSPDSINYAPHLDQYRWK